MDYSVVFVERTLDGRDQRRTERLATPAADPIVAYREASARWMSGSAAGHRYNLEVRPLVGAAVELERV